MSGLVDRLMELARSFEVIDETDFSVTYADGAILVEAAEEISLLRSALKGIALLDSSEEMTREQMVSIARAALKCKRLGLLGTMRKEKMSEPWTQEMQNIKMRELDSLAAEKADEWRASHVFIVAMFEGGDHSHTVTGGQFPPEILKAISEAMMGERRLGWQTQ